MTGLARRLWLELKLSLALCAALWAGEKAVQQWRYRHA